VALPADTVAAIAQRLAERAGLELPPWVVDARATARIALLGCTPADYVALIDSGRGAGELTELIEAVRVGESRLFRHRGQVDALAGVIAPALQARGRTTGRRAIRVWSAGCAAGEEPYTLAIVLSRALPDCTIAIVATDVSGDALARAAGASYPRAALDHVPHAYRDAFIADGETVRVAPEIAALVRFERANLVDGATPRDCDLVWCRNVLIYFTAGARRRVIDRLVGATLPGGFVFVGYSESLRDVDELEAVRAGDVVYYVRRTGDPARRRTATTPVPAVPAAIPAPVADRRSVPVALPDDRTPPPVVLPREPPADDTLALRGHPVPAYTTAELSARLALPGLRSLTVDLDGAELLGDDLAPVLRRARAAARTAGIALVVRATRAGARRWMARHRLDEEAG
jgi:chemotaxis protein methyltransferase CheR